ncbi:M48 family metalloprotease [Simkania sp.]|uniref:M48 family metalloprotease n=1 Tax=Simkania sp. TaxID=34094 RepID=UPI003B5216F2
MVSRVEAQYQQAEQFRSANSSRKFTQAFQHHMLGKAPHRIPELMAVIVNRLLPPLAHYLANLASNMIEFQVITEDDSKWKELTLMTEKLRLKAGLKEKITPCYCPTDSSLITSFDHAIVLSEYLLTCPVHEKEFLIMHEIQHIHLSHLTIRLGLSYFFAALDLILLYYCPLAILCVESAAFFIENAVYQSQEYQADFEAIKALGSNRGAIEAFRKKMDSIYPLPATFLTGDLRHEAKKIQEWACNYSEPDHPSVTNRLHAALKIP